jgi:hypothetical protein
MLFEDIPCPYFVIFYYELYRYDEQTSELSEPPASLRMWSANFEWWNMLKIVNFLQREGLVDRKINSMWSRDSFRFGSYK